MFGSTPQFGHIWLEMSKTNLLQLQHVAMGSSLVLPQTSTRSETTKLYIFIELDFELLLCVVWNKICLIKSLLNWIWANSSFVDPVLKIFKICVKDWNICVCYSASKHLLTWKFMDIKESTLCESYSYVA